MYVYIYIYTLLFCHPTGWPPLNLMSRIYTLMPSSAFMDFNPSVAQELKVQYGQYLSPL